VAYALATLLLLGVVTVIALVRGQRRRVREMQALKAVMQQVLDGDPEAPQSED